MAARRNSDASLSKTRRAPAVTPDERENQLVSAAVDLAEQQIRAGQASSQVITHFLKLGSSRERLEQQRLTNEVSLLETKRLMMESEKRVEELIGNALEAMAAYSGHIAPETEQDYDD